MLFQTSGAARALFTALCAVLTFCATTATAASSLQGRVVGVTDGDTLTVLTPEKRQVVIRLAAVDAPETSCHAQASASADARCTEKAQPFGKAAKRLLSSLAFGKQVTVQLTGEQTYGREVGTVWVAGVDANYELVAAGLACHYERYARRLQDPQTFARYAQAQAAARQARKGQWAAPDSVCPWEYRARQREDARR